MPAPQHKHHGKPTYLSWRAMKARCLNPNDPAFSRYGGRGIRVCQEWLDFRAFLRDMGPRPEGTSLDRIDNDKGYEPGNCRWADKRQQQANRRCAAMVEFEGRPVLLKQLARDCGIHADTLKYRIRKLGMTAELAVSTPVAASGNRHSKE